MTAPMVNHADKIAVADTTAETCQICVEDTVRLKERTWLIGVVDVDTHEPDPQRDYNLMIERHLDVPKEKYEEFMKNGIPPRGTCLVSWQTDFTTELLPVAAIELVDRTFFVGDVVKRNANEPMSGTVIGTRLEVTIAPIRMWPDIDQVRAGQPYEKLIGDDVVSAPPAKVPAGELETIRQFPEGALVIYGNWVGRIDDAYDEVTLRLSNGTVVVVENSDELQAVDPRLERHEVGDYVYTKKGNLRRGRWIFGAFTPNVEPGGAVIDVRTTSITVHWLSRRIGAPGDSTEPPMELGLDELESGRLTVYDNMRMPSGGVAPTAAIRFGPDLTPGQRVRFKDLTGACVKYQPVIKKRPRTETLGYDTNVYTVQTTSTTVITQWQDLSITEDRSCDILPDPNIDDEDEVWPGELICTNEEKARVPATGGQDEQAEWYQEPAKVGVVQSVDGRDRMATVKWFPDASVKLVDNDLLPGSKTGVASGPDERVSLYDIRTTLALNRRRGDYVIIVDSERSAASSDIDWFGEVVDLGLDGLLTIRLSAANPVRDVKVPLEGVILAYSTDTDLEQLNAQNDYDSMSEDEDYEPFGDVDDEDDYREMWYEYQNGQRVRVEEESDEGGDWATEDEDDDNASSAEENDVSMEEGTTEVDTSKTTPEVQEEENKEENNTSEPFSFARFPNAPPAFAILEDSPPEDHHFIKAQGGDGSQQRMRRLQKEHKILNSSLPPGIFVRTWESRLDLLRVLIIGPVDTPYEYAPFVIDFHLGPNFGPSPPEAFFHSWTGGLGPVNPNLYEDGKICLSLLGTWHGDQKHENWSSKSTIMQVLVSLLGLVLVREPYYNEAGYEVRQGTEETTLSSALYSEKAYFRARGFIMHGLKHMPVPFQEEMRWLYHDTNGPKLLQKAIDATKAIIAKSEGGGNAEEKRDGLKKVSAGAVIPLKRQLEGLEKLTTSNV